MQISNAQKIDEEGYEDINNIQNKTNQLYDKQLEQQKDIINTGTEQTINELEKKKQETEEDVNKTNKALYTDYKKQINPYGANAENLAEQGLSNSGLAETTKLGYYNSYQNARTEARNNANKIKANFDAQIAKARQDGDLQLAQSTLNIYKQQIDDLYNIYNLKFNREQFNYNKEQDALSQSNWEKQYQQSLEQAQWERQFNKEQFDYQKEKDKQEQSNWEKEYELNKTIQRAKASQSSGTTLNVDDSLTGLSDYAQSLYNSYSNLLAKAKQGGIAGKMVQALAKNPTMLTTQISSEYQKGNITQDDVRVLCARLGLE